MVAACILPPGLCAAPLIDDSKKMSEAQREEAFEWLVGGEMMEKGFRWAAVVVSHRTIDELNILNATTLGMSLSLSALTKPYASKFRRIEGEAAGSSSSIASDIAGNIYLSMESKGKGDGKAPSSHFEASGCDGHKESDVLVVRSLHKEPFTIPPQQLYALIDGNRVPKDISQVCLGGEAVVKGDAKVLSISAASVVAKVLRDKIMLLYAKEYTVYGFEQHFAYGVPSHLAAIKMHGPSPIHRKSFNPVRTMLGWEREEKEVQRSEKSDGAQKRAKRTDAANQSLVEEKRGVQKRVKRSDQAK